MSSEAGNFQVKIATRQGVKPLVGMYGKSGAGKTMSALLFARGLVGISGRIVLIDSESGRGSLFADIIPGGYSVIDLQPPFSPERYQQAIELAESNADCVVIDSLSHEHNGEGGVLDMQEEELDRMAGKNNWAKREACKMASWIAPKMAHKKMIQRLLRSKVALICCLRGEEKTHMIKGDDGKNKVITDPFSSPIFDSRFLFELLLNFEVIARTGIGGFTIPRKITHPSIAALLPGEAEQIATKHGAALAQWCAAPGGTFPVNGPEKLSEPQSDLKKLKHQLWKLTRKIHNGDPKKLSQHLWDENFMADTESLETLSAERISKIISTLK